MCTEQYKDFHHLGVFFVRKDIIILLIFKHLKKIEK